jgi:hypothetical protein
MGAGSSRSGGAARMTSHLNDVYTGEGWLSLG